MNDYINLEEYPVKDILQILLKDKTTGKNIIFATDNYAAYGDGYGEQDEITVEKLKEFDGLELQPRVLKSLEAQKLRTKVKAEVMTPSWVVCKMNAHCDEEWFGRPDVFETTNEMDWQPVEGRIVFPEKKNWKAYVDLRRIEITCGEAPYVVSRYDTTTGEMLPISRRVGFLDRKIRVVNENAETEEEWLKWVTRAYESSYGYEWQGDNLLIARINLVNTFADYMEARWNRKPAKAELRKICNVIVWNFWQMDAFTCTVPYGVPEKEENEDICIDEAGDDWLSAFGEPETTEPKNITPVCVIRDWREYSGGKAHKFTEIKERHR